MPLFVVDRCRDALEAKFRFLFVVGDAVAANLVQFLFQGRQCGQRVWRLAGQPGSPRIVANLLRRIGGQEQFAERSQVQRRPPPTRYTTRTSARPEEVRSI